MGVGAAMHGKHSSKESIVDGRNITLLLTSVNKSGMPGTLFSLRAVKRENTIDKYAACVGCSSAAGDTSHRSRGRSSGSGLLVGQRGAVPTSLGCAPEGK